MNWYGPFSWPRSSTRGSLPISGTMDAPTRSISSLVARILAGFETIFKLIEPREFPKDTARFQTHLARFKLWAGSMGAHCVLGTRSLEYRLRDASSMRKHVLSLLEDLDSIVLESELDHRIGGTPRRQRLRRRHQSYRLLSLAANPSTKKPKRIKTPSRRR